MATMESVIAGLTGGGGIGGLIGSAASAVGGLPTDLIPSSILASLPTGVPTDISSIIGGS